jgi:hypothetical protein
MKQATSGSEIRDTRCDIPPQGPQDSPKNAKYQSKQAFDNIKERVRDEGDLYRETAYDTGKDADCSCTSKRVSDSVGEKLRNEGGRLIGEVVPGSHEP